MTRKSPWSIALLGALLSTSIATAAPKDANASWEGIQSQPNLDRAAIGKRLLVTGYGDIARLVVEFRRARHSSAMRPTRVASVFAAHVSKLGTDRPLYIAAVTYDMTSESLYGSNPSEATIRTVLANFDLGRTVAANVGSDIELVATATVEEALLNVALTSPYIDDALYQGYDLEYEVAQLYEVMGGTMIDKTFGFLEQVQTWVEMAEASGTYGWDWSDFTGAVAGGAIAGAVRGGGAGAAAGASAGAAGYAVSQLSSYFSDLWNQSWDDLDGDGTPNCMDSDMDGDGVHDALDSDDDNDGIEDEDDPVPGLPADETKGDYGDGKDDDNDGNSGDDIAPWTEGGGWWFVPTGDLLDTLLSSLQDLFPVPTEIDVQAYDLGKIDVLTFGGLK